jgi:hypothetical protein
MPPNRAETRPELIDIDVKAGGVAVAAANFAILAAK